MTAVKEKAANGPATTSTPTPAPEAAKAPAPATPPAGGFTYPGGPVGMIQKLADEMNRVFEEIVPGFGFGRMAPMSRLMPRARALMAEMPIPWAPKIEMTQKGGELIVTAELPGLTKDEIFVDVAPGMLTLHGERKKVTEEKGKGTYHSEMTYGAFYRDIPLPEGADVDKAAVTFKNGMLSVTVPVTPKPGTRRIEVKEA